MRSWKIGIVVAVAALVVGLLADRFILYWARSVSPHPQGSSASPKNLVWTCSMHPQIRLPAPGQCPICGMDLIPAQEGGGAGGEVVLGEGARRVASIEVAEVDRRPLSREVRTVGRVDYAEPHVAHLSARIGGRIERLYADFTGVPVAKGDHLVDIYSPDLILAQEELILSVRHLAGTPEGAPGRRAAEAVLDAARQKLLLWGVTEEQIEEIRKQGKARNVLTLYAPIGGTVIEKSIREGQYVEMGEPLYTIADLSTVWLYADVYEYELPWVEVAQAVEVTAEGAPGERFAGTVSFVDPMVREETRTVRVRASLPNAGGRLKPGMFASVSIRARLDAGGKRVPSPLAGKYVCPMHLEVVSDAAGDCRVCGMALVKVPGEAPSAAEGKVYLCPMECEPPSSEPGRCGVCGMERKERERSELEGRDPLAVPVSAVLDTGARQVVYVEKEPGRYEAREVRLGPRAGDHYAVLSGIREGERVVVHGNFLLDSQAQIEGKPSLLFPEGILSAPPGAHPDHGRPE